MRARRHETQGEHHGFRPCLRGHAAKLPEASCQRLGDVAYGDDAQASTNYPIVRITNRQSGHVQYVRTHDHSYMGVSSGKRSHTTFDVPATLEAGASKLEVVANGIASQPIDVRITH